MFNQEDWFFTKKDSYGGNVLRPKVGKIVATATGALLVLVVVFGSFGTVGAGERGVKTRLGAIVGTIEPGLYFKIPLVENVSRMEVKTRTVNYDKNGKEGDATDTSQLSGASKDLQDVWIGVVVNYHINPAKVTAIYAQYSSVENYESNVIEPIIREIVKTTSAQYTAEELVTKRAEVGDKVTASLADRFVTKDAILERFSITNFEFSKAFTQAIESKVTAVQNAEAAKNKLEQIKFEAQQTVETAKATAEAIRLQSEAANNEKYVSLKALEVQQKAIEKWNGVLPTQMIPAATLPFINLTK